MILFVLKNVKINNTSAKRQDKKKLTIVRIFPEMLLIHKELYNSYQLKNYITINAFIKLFKNY